MQKTAIVVLLGVLLTLTACGVLAPEQAQAMLDEVARQEDAGLISSDRAAAARETIKGLSTGFSFVHLEAAIGSVLGLVGVAFGLRGAMVGRGLQRAMTEPGVRPDPELWARIESMAQSATPETAARPA